MNALVEADMGGLIANGFPNYSLITIKLGHIIHERVFAKDMSADEAILFDTNLDSIFSTIGPDVFTVRFPPILAATEETDMNKFFYETALNWYPSMTKAIAFAHHTLNHITSSRNHVKFMLYHPYRQILQEEFTIARLNASGGSEGRLREFMIIDTPEYSPLTLAKQHNMAKNYFFLLDYKLFKYSYQPAGFLCEKYNFGETYGSPEKFDTFIQWAKNFELNDDKEYADFNQRPPDTLTNTLPSFNHQELAVSRSLLESDFGAMFYDNLPSAVPELFAAMQVKIAELAQEHGKTIKEETYSRKLIV